MLSGYVSLFETLQQNAVSHRGREAMVFEDQRYDYAQTYERVCCLIQVLTDYHVALNSRVLWVGKNSNVLLELFFACSAIGAVLCPSNWRQSDSELSFVLADFEPSVVFYDDLGLSVDLEQLKQSSSEELPWISVRDTQNFDAMLGKKIPVSAVHSQSPDIQRPLLVIYTAAFEGEPCGAQLSEPGLSLQGLLHAKTFEVDRNSKTLLSSPNFHMVFWLDFLPTFLMGGQVVIAADTDASTILDLIQENGLTGGTLHLPTAQAITELNRDKHYDIRHFRSPLKFEGWSGMVSFGPGISGVGQTEICGPVINGAFADDCGAFTGRCAPLVLAKVVDGQMREVVHGEVGELIVKGPVTGLGYWRRPEVNRQRTLQGGWWRTNDLVRLEENGAITFIGPMSQMVKSGGENVYATEVENVLREIPAIKDVGIIGIPDQKWGQVVTAVVELHEGFSEDERSIQDYVKSRIARYKAPKKVFYVDAMPKRGFTIDYGALDKRFGGGGYPGQQ